MTKEYDAIIIGGGAGLKIARPAGDLGYKIAVIEPGPLGGTCLNRGCIPSKMIIHPADIVQALREGGVVEVSGEAKIDTPKLIERVTDTVDEESKSIIPLLEKHENVDLYKECARFIDHKTIEAGEHKLVGKKIFIAAGARSHLPSIKGLKDVPYMTSTELLKCQKLPKKIVIIGAGYIACELGHYLDAAGAQVHFIVRSRPLRHLDEEIQREFEKCFEGRFQIHKGEPEEVYYDNGTFQVRWGHSHIEADGLLIASGMVPNTDSLDLDKAGVEVDERGYIKIDEHLQTTREGIYAFGDIIGRYLFRHSANFEGEYLLYEHFTHPESKKAIDYPPVPYGVFSWPQVAGVGKQEEELEKGSYIVGVNRYKNSAMGMALNHDCGLCKLLFDKKSLKLIGAHIVGEQATTMIHMLIAYINMGATLEDMLRTIYIHPALPEIVRNAARRAKAQIGE